MVTPHPLIQGFHTLMSFMVPTTSGNLKSRETRKTFNQSYKSQLETSPQKNPHVISFYVYDFWLLFFQAIHKKIFPTLFLDYVVNMDKFVDSILDVVDIAHN